MEVNKRTIGVKYGVSFGAADSSEWIDWKVDLTEEEAIVYKNAVEKGILLNDIPELENALTRAYKEIE